MRILFLFILKLLLSCTSNPFWDDPGTVELVLSGNVSTENNNMDVPISVYLETFDIYTRTDQDGDFSITIQNTQSTDGSVSGSLKIYFFIYNYQLDSAVVNFVNGRLSNNQSDFSTDGELVKPIQLKKILSGELNFEFLENGFFDKETLAVVFDVDIHTEVDIDIYKYIWVEDTLDFYSGLIFNNLNNDTTILYRFSGYDDSGNIVNDQLKKLSFEENEQTQWQYLIQTDQLYLSTGQYKIVPYFFIKHDFIPQGMIDKMGGDQIFSFSNEYLMVPIDITPLLVFIE